MTVLPWQEGAEASVLPQACQDLLEVAADALARCSRHLASIILNWCSSYGSDDRERPFPGLGLRSRRLFLAGICRTSRWPHGPVTGRLEPTGKPSAEDSMLPQFNKTMIHNGMVPR